MVAIAIETMITIKKPKRIYEMCTRERANAIMLFISVILITLDLHFFWTHGLVRPGDDPHISIYMCTYVSELSDKFRDYIWPIINFLIEHVSPWCIILVCMLYSIIGLVKRDRKADEEYLKKYFLDTKTLHQLNKSVFIICLIAGGAYTLDIISISIHWMASHNFISIEYEHSFLMRSFLAVLSNVFISHKFWVFYICCDKFRQDVKCLWHCMCRPLRRQRRHNRKCITSADTNKACSSWQDTDTCLSEELHERFASGNIKLSL